MAGKGYQGIRKPSTAHQLKVVIRELAKAGGLKHGAVSTLSWHHDGEVSASLSLLAGPDFLALDYQGHHQVVSIERTPCNLGGSRMWGLCPFCKRRIDVLYLSPAIWPRGFACVRCCGLNYQSTRDTPANNAMHQAEAIRARLGWPRGIIHGYGPKPRGLHWPQFVRIKAKYDKFVKIAFPYVTQ